LNLIKTIQIQEIQIIKLFGRLKCGKEQRKPNLKHILNREKLKK